MRVATRIVLSDEEQAELTKLVRSRLSSVRLAQRARIVLLAAQGLQNQDIADQLGIGRVQVGRWRDRYAESRLEGIERDLPRGAPPRKGRGQTGGTDHAEAATHWSTRKMGAVMGVSPSTVMRHWQANGLKPHLVRSFGRTSVVRLPPTNRRHCISST